jgi:hypothetical protein
VLLAEIKIVHSGKNMIGSVLEITGDYGRRYPCRSLTITEHSSQPGKMGYWRRVIQE